MPKETFMVLPGEERKTRRKELAIKRYYSTRQRYWERRGCPPLIAHWLAKEGFPVYPKGAPEKKTKERIVMYLREMEDDIKEYRDEGLTKSQATRKFLNGLKEKNKRYQREPYNLFTLGS